MSTLETLAAAFGCAVFFTGLLLFVASAFDDDDDEDDDQ